jgi:DNA-binding CsgD family transcriptional regulator
MLGRVTALRELGLSDIEEQIYLATLDRAAATLDDLVSACDSPHGQIGDALDVLQERGLLMCRTGTPPTYFAVRPDLAVGVLVREREARLAEVREMLAALTERHRNALRGSNIDDLIEIVQTPDAIHQRWLQLQRSARTEIRVLDKPPYIDPGNPEEPGLLVTGVRFRTVYDRTALAEDGKLTGMWEAAAAGEDGRIAADVPIKLLIADHQMALAPLRRADDLAGAVVVHPSTLLDALGALFENVWQRALPLAAFHEGRSRSAMPLPPQQRKLLQLMAGGCTDETTARLLGVSQRTVQRQIRMLMERFGVQTRFQLGLRAAALVEVSAGSS